MSHTRFPNGVSVSTGTSIRTTNGQMYADSAAIAGVCSINTLQLSTANNGYVGQLVYIPVYFGTASAAQNVFAPGPGFAGSVVGAIVTIGSVSAIASQYSVLIGSAGAVCVATVTNTLTASGSAESLATTEQTFTAAQGFKCTRAVQGTAGDSILMLLVKRTA